MEKINFYEKVNDLRSEIITEIINIVKEESVNVPFYLCAEEESEILVDELENDYQYCNIINVDDYSYNYNNIDIEYIYIYRLEKGRLLQVNNKGVLIAEEECVDFVPFEDLTMSGLIEVYESISKK
ncbi:MAG: hypothetical protein J6U90_03725 [Methanobrevibacter sp.]|nr:hypothetical protein [Methanobrevibacter sp.]